MAGGRERRGGLPSHAAARGTPRARAGFFAGAGEHAGPMRSRGNDRWQAEFIPRAVVPHYFTIEAWLDVWSSYRADLGKNADAGVAGSLEVEEGRIQVLAA